LSSWVHSFLKLDLRLILTRCPVFAAATNWTVCQLAAPPKRADIELLHFEECLRYPLDAVLIVAAPEFRDNGRSNLSKQAVVGHQTSDQQGELTA
jgi:hypothetical protein